MSIVLSRRRALTLALLLVLCLGIGVFLTSIALHTAQTTSWHVFADMTPNVIIHNH